MISTFLLFYPQIILGTILGALISIIGVFFVLRKKAFFGITLSQVISSSMALSLFIGIENELFIILLSCIFFIPLVLFFNLEESEDSILGIIFVSFTAFTQILLNFGGNVKNHIMASYFGDILTSQMKLNSTLFILLFISIFIFIILYPRILFLSFDKDEYKTRYGKTIFVDLGFYISMTIIVSITVNLLGSFYTIAHLLMPAFIGLFFARSMRSLFIIAILYSVFFTFSGFLISLFPFKYNETEIYFPTSSMIISFMSLVSFIIIFYRKLKSKFF